MSDLSGAKPRGGFLKWALWGAALFGVAAVVYIIAQSSFKPQADNGLRWAARGAMAKLQFPTDPTPTPANAFADAQGRPVRIADFRGKVLVLNLWATWCPPCVTEMPTLARLQAEYAGKPVVVAPVSVDEPLAIDKARLFIGQHPPLAFYSDPGMKMPFAFKPPVPGMPTTIIYGPDGRERARLSGGADWSGPDARALIDKLLAGG
jgi:thiol-disulfide isomerase/thioredoxin